MSALPVGLPELNIDMVTILDVGRGRFDRGIEADKTYSIAHEPAVCGVTGDTDLMLPWAEASEAEPDNRWERRLRAWVRAELAPRRVPDHRSRR